MKRLFFFFLCAAAAPAAQPSDHDRNSHRSSKNSRTGQVVLFTTVAFITGGTLFYCSTDKGNNLPLTPSPQPTPGPPIDEAPLPDSKGSGPPLVTAPPRLPKDLLDGIRKGGDPKKPRKQQKKKIPPQKKETPHALLMAQIPGARKKLKKVEPQTQEVDGGTNQTDNFLIDALQKRRQHIKENTDSLLPLNTNDNEAWV